MTVTVEEVIRRLTEPGGHVLDTVDHLITGSPDTQVKRIGVTFVASQAVIRQAVEMGIELLITHEGIYYSHKDGYPEEPDTVFETKRELIQESGLAIYRFHDHIHRYKPDGVTRGLIHALGWQSYIEKEYAAAAILSMPEQSVREIAQYIKVTLGIGSIRLAGELEQTCRRAAVLVGYRGGGQLAIPLFSKENVDLIICGEGPEWETPEYVRDAADQGRSKALLILGHAESEQPGMRCLAERMRGWFPETEVHFLENKPLFQIV